MQLIHIWQSYYVNYKDAPSIIYYKQALKRIRIKLYISVYAIYILVFFILLLLKIHCCSLHCLMNNEN